ncbi:MAG: N-6 DNA methylase [Acidobacteriota bacterium]
MAQKNLFPTKINRETLNALVDRAADLIRTAVDYKFILVLLFLKRLNDVRKRERKQIKDRLIEESGLSEKEAEEEAEKFDDFYTFDIPEQYLWDEIGGDVKNLPEKLATSISEIAKQNKELQGVIDRVDFLEFARNQENRELLRQLIELFNKYDLGGLDVSPDILGDAYEHIIMKFAPQKAKEGEIYTPREVIKLMIEILDPKPGQKVYDPCCGSGGMLIGSYTHVEEKYGEEEARKIFLYGQERNPELYAIGQMNLILHGIKSGNLASGDTLDYPRFRENGKLQQFHLVIANPPWNQDGYGEDRLKRADFRERFSLGYPPNDKGDWAWIQHMLASSKGKVAVVLDQGALFRGGKEKTIRKKVVEADWIECVILLAEKLFYNTGASGIVVVFNKNKPESRKDKILFINGLEKFDKHPEVRRLNTMTSENIGEINKAYEKFSEDTDFAKVVSRDKIRENDFNLNVPLYTPLIKEEEKIDIKKVYTKLSNLRKEREEKEKRIREDLENIMKVI